jgi:hypothetical protein
MALASFYSTAADITVVLHFLWIVFLIFGAFIGRRHKWVKRIHLGGIAFALVLQFSGWYCPFTYLEIRLRRLHDPSQSYSGSFIIHYVEKIVYINLHPEVILLLTIVLAIISAWLYYPRKSRKPYM